MSKTRISRTKKRGGRSRRPSPPGPRRRPIPTGTADLETLRLESLLTDRVTGLKTHPLADLHGERVPHLGIVYLQLGRFSGVESLYGWELYDRVLRLAAESLRAELQLSAFKASALSLQFNGCDGFYILFDLPSRGAQVRGLEAEAQR